MADLADQLVTCVYLVDQSTHEVTLCSAGHLPVIAPGGPARILRTPVGVPLGVKDPCSAGVPFRKATRPVPPGSTLAVCTDGLVERPGTDIETRIDPLARTLDLAPKGAPVDQEGLDQAADLLIKTPLPDMATHDDDVTLLLIGLPMPKGEGFRA